MWKMFCIFILAYQCGQNSQTIQNVTFTPGEKDTGECQPYPRVSLLIFSDRVLFLTDHAGGIRETVPLRNGHGSTIFYTKQGNRYMIKVDGTVKKITMWSVQYGCLWESEYR